jgi:hypothetical protein
MAVAQKKEETLMNTVNAANFNGQKPTIDPYLKAQQVANEHEVLDSQR